MNPAPDSQPHSSSPSSSRAHLQELTPARLGLGQLCFGAPKPFCNTAAERIKADLNPRAWEWHDGVKDHWEQAAEQFKRKHHVEIKVWCGDLFYVPVNHSKLQAGYSPAVVLYARAHDHWVTPKFLFEPEEDPRPFDKLNIFTKGPAAFLFTPTLASLDEAKFEGLHGDLLVSTPAVHELVVKSAYRLGYRGAETLRYEPQIIASRKYDPPHKALSSGEYLQPLILQKLQQIPSNIVEGARFGEIDSCEIELFDPTPGITGVCGNLVLQTKFLSEQLALLAHARVVVSFTRCADNTLDIALKIESVTKQC